MLIEPSNVSDCNAIIRNTIQCYELFARARTCKRSTKELLKHCREELDKTIIVKEIIDSRNIDTVNGFCLAMKDGSYLIGLKEELNNCWTRLVLAKELFHVLLDNPEYANLNLTSHVEATTSNPTGPELEPSPGSAQVEYLAEYAAMEFLFPYADRVKIKELNAAIDYDLFAEEFKVPRLYVEKYLTDAYMQVIGEMMKA